MTFYSLEKEERADWREGVATKLALKMLRENQASEEAAALGCVRLGDAHGATLHTGMAQGFETAISLMERDE